MANAFSHAGGRLTPRHATDTVSNRPLKTLTVSPGTASKAHNATQQYTVAGDDGYENSCPIPAADIAWTTTVTGGTVSATGLVTVATTDGTFKVRATHTPSGIYDESDVVVHS